MNTDQPVSPETLMEHLRASHANVQDVIKFVDTKTGALTGLVTLILTFPFLLARYFTGDNFDLAKWKNPFPAHPDFPTVALIVLSVSLLGGIASICCSLTSLVARPPSRWIKPKNSQKDQFCILFPFYTPKQAPAAHEYFSKIVSGLTQKELLIEYQHQAEQLGSIVERKIRWHRRAALLLRVQLVLPLIVMIPFGVARGSWLLLSTFGAWLRDSLQSRLAQWRSIKQTKAPSKRKAKG
jgi:hypothetical protein